MSKPINIPVVAVYDSLTEWDVNTGQSEQIVPKKITGRYRNLKNIGMLVWLIYLLGPYLRWDGNQAVLFDIPKQQFHLFSATVFPQDIWVLALTLLFFAILLAVATSVAGRVFCGYFCFQTVWTEVFIFIESQLEGDTPHKRNKFKQAPWTQEKVIKKLTKHILWLAIALLTGITFVAWFTDAYQLWRDIFIFKLSLTAWFTLATFTFFTYWFAGFMREQVCFWLCPYARLQGVMYDQDTVLPAYDAQRGEPRGKLSQQQAAEQGACIDCNVCVAVCPTGIDIRKGQQEGCITCGLCIDACDSIMDKIQQPRGLIRYASHKELLLSKLSISLFKRPRILVYGFILLLCFTGITYGFNNFSSTEFYVNQERRPLFTRMSNGDIQNKYTLKLLNKTKETIRVRYSVSGLNARDVLGLDNIVTVEAGKAVPVTALIRQTPSLTKQPNLQNIRFTATIIEAEHNQIYYDAVFFSP